LPARAIPRRGGRGAAYGIPNYAVDHHPADDRRADRLLALGRTQLHLLLHRELHRRAGACRRAGCGVVPHGDARQQPRLARCLQTAAQLGGWQGGQPGSGQGIACHSFRGSYIAVMAEAQLTSDRKVKVERLVAAVDCGRMVNPDLVKQQIEGGLIFGMAAAIGASTGFTENVADVREISELGLPTLADCPTSPWS
jgi:isoquinoline 1-oxidoreductase beta subunit